MNDYAIVSIIMVVTAMIIAAGLYAKHKFGLATKIYLMVIFVMMSIAMMAYYLGKEEPSLGLLGLLVTFAAGLVLLAIFLLRSIVVSPIVNLSEQMRRTAEERDLSITIKPSNRQDEIGAMEVAYTAMTGNMQELVRALQEGIAQLVSSSSQLSSSAAQSVATASEQSSVAAEVSTTVEEITQTSKSTAGNAHQVVNVTEQALETDRQVMRSVESAMGKMENISDRVSAVVSKINKLDIQNAQISEIVDAVGELAGQSNLLAVNASIEASRAREHGRGFAVVASEVRNLADQSKRSTKRIQKIIAEIRLSSTEAVAATEQSRKQSAEGKEAIGAVSDFIEELSRVLEQSSNQARQIFAASSQQAAGIKQISEAMIQVKRGGEDMTNTAKMLEGAVTELTQLGARLNTLIEQYRV